jgi:hypothetical protein
MTELILGFVLGFPFGAGLFFYIGYREHRRREQVTQASVDAIVEAMVQGIQSRQDTKQIH